MLSFSLLLIVVSTYLTNIITRDPYRDVKQCSTHVKDDEIDLSSRLFKAIQTSFSTIDLLSKKNCSDCYRKIKSQENVRAEKDTCNELMEWIKDIYRFEVSSKFWNNRMKKLALKLAKPGGEARIRDKIRKYLDGETSSLKYNDERRKFREQLPDYIINSLKKYLKFESNRSSSPIRIYRIEIPSYDDNKNYEKRLKKVIVNWLNNIPIRKKDFLNRPINREDIVSFMIKQLEPYKSDIQDFDVDSKSVLIGVVKTLLSEIPIQGPDNCLDTLASSLVDKLCETYIETSEHCKVKETKSNVEVKPITLQDLALRQLSNMLEDIIVLIDSKGYNLLKEELANLLMNVTDLEYYTTANLQKNVCRILYHLGGLNNYQAQYFSKKILNRLQNDINSWKCKNNADDGNERSPLVSHSDIQSVYYNKYNHIPNADQTTAVEQANEYKCDHRQLIMTQIEEWFHEISSIAPMSLNYILQHEVVKNLAEDIIDRFQYLEMSPVSHNENDVDYLKYQIFKWISKVTKENIVQIIDHAPLLMARIKSIHVPRLQKNKDELKNILRLSFRKSDFIRLPILPKINHLLVAIIDWFDEVLKTPKVISIKLAKELLYMIQIGLVKNELDFVINYEIHNWLKTFSKVELVNLEKLNQTLKTILDQSTDISQENFKGERKQILIYEDIINGWLDKCLFDKKYILSAQERNSFINILAVTLLHAQYLSKGIPKEDLIYHMKRLVSEWTYTALAQICQGANITDQCILQLVRYILDCNLNYENDLEQNQTSRSQINSSLKNWSKTLPLYSHKCIGENKKVGLMAEENHSGKIETDSFGEPLKSNEAVLDENKEFNEIKHSDFQAYLQELNLFCETSKNDECNQHFCSKCNSPEILNMVEENNKVSSKVTVYGFTLPTTSKEKSNHLQDESIKPITEADIAANHELYLKQLVKEIDEWLNGLKISKMHDNGFREIVVNDLAGDIIDRQKYLQLNNLCEGVEKYEVDQLRYQIFKWINKLVGENHQETLEHAPELMDRIRRVPVPMFTRKDCKNQLHIKEFEKIKYLCDDSPNSCDKGNTNLTNAKLSTSLEIPTECTFIESKEKVNSITRVGSKEQIIDLQRTEKTSEDKGHNESHGIEIPDTSVKYTQCDSLNEKLESMSLLELYKYFDEIFKTKIEQLPFESCTQDQAYLAHLAKVGMYNAIWKTFYALSGEPEIANDYCLFELLFEERIDKILDCLPQTTEFQRIRVGWKSKLLNDLLLMLKYMHAITDKPHIRDIILNKVDRKIMRSMLISNSDKAQHCFVAKTVDDYILSIRYKDDNPIRANVYRHRLMKRLEELAENVKLQNKVEFYEINPSQLCQIAFKILGEVPIPNKEELKKEAEEIFLEEEIEQWYKDLPTKPIVNENNAYLRQRLREILAKRLFYIQNKIDALGDPSLELERDLKHEISKYLENDADLEKVNDLNINFMVEELAGRLKSRREYNMLGYDEFQKDNPASSTLIQTSPEEILAPLVDINKNIINHTSGENYFLRPIERCRRLSTSHRNNGISRVEPTNQELDFSAINYRNNTGTRSLSPGFQTQNFSTRESNRPELDQNLQIGSLRPNNQRSVQVNIPPYAIQEMNKCNANFLSPGNFSKGQSSQGPSRRFMTKSSTGITQPTARINTGVFISGPQLSLERNSRNGEGKVKYKCHCMDLLPTCRGGHTFCDDLTDYHPCYPPLPFSGYFY